MGCEFILSGLSGFESDTTQTDQASVRDIDKDEQGHIMLRVLLWVVTVYKYRTKRA